MMLRQTKTSVSVFLHWCVASIFYFFWKLPRLFSVVGAALDPGFQIFTFSTITEIVDRRFSILRNLTFNGRMARANRVQVSVTYYEACKDVNHEAYGSRGRYKTITGICWNVDAEVTKTILVDKMRIPMGDIVKVEAPGEIFETRWEDQSAD